MSEESPKVEVRDLKYAGVSTEHPTIVATIRNLARKGESMAVAQKIVGMPLEVIVKHYRAVREEKK